MEKNYAGINWSNGMSNINKDTGIHYGVIHQREVLQTWCDSSEANYPEIELVCPKCNGELIKISEGTSKQLEENGGVEVTGEEYRCENCDMDFNEFDHEIEGQAMDLEPSSFFYNNDGYECEQEYDNPDIFVLKSPYYTYCQYCSPCAPGAGYIMNSVEGGVKSYCLGHDWFESQETGETITCQYCEGKGKRHYQKGDGAIYATCHVCGGSGKVKETITKAPYPVFSVETGEIA